MTTTWAREYRVSLSAFGVALRSPALRRITIAYGFAAMDEAATWIALGVYAYARGGATEVGVVGLAILLPAALMAPVASSLADRHRRQRVLLLAYVVHTAAAAGVALTIIGGGNAVVVYAFATVATLTTTPLRPTQGALLLSVSRSPADLTSGNVALAAVRNIGLLVGPLVAFALLRADGEDGPGWIFAFAVLGGAVASFLIAGVPRDRKRERPGGPGLHPVIEGVRLLMKEERAALVVALTFAKHIVMGALRAFLVIVAFGLLGMGTGGPGSLSIALGIGGALGGGLSVALVGRRRLAPPLLIGGVALGGSIAVIGIWPAVGVALIALVAAGSGRSLIDVAGRTLLGRVAPEAAVARFLGMLEGSTYAGLAIGSGIVALLIPALGIRRTVVVVGLSLPALVAFLWGPLTRIDTSPLVSRDLLERILAVPMFAALPAELVERLASKFTRVVRLEGSTFIRQGDVGDHFYILDTGAAVVVVDDAIVATYRPGDSFGEIALLRDVPRTATVRATEPSAALVLHRSEFLRVLTNDPTGRSTAEQVADARLLDTETKRNERDAGPQPRSARRP